MSLYIYMLSTSIIDKEFLFFLVLNYLGVKSRKVCHSIVDEIDGSNYKHFKGESQSE